MKKYIKNRISAAADTEQVVNAVDLLGDLYSLATNAGYNMDVSDDMEITVRAAQDRRFMPEISIVTEHDSDGVYFVPTVKFPVLDQNKMEYYDDIETYIRRWQPIGVFISAINRTTIQL